jgi:hypothetical protein
MPTDASIEIMPQTPPPRRLGRSNRAISSPL